MEKTLEDWKEYYKSNKLSLNEEVALIISGDALQLRAYIETNILYPRSYIWFSHYASEELLQIYQNLYNIRT